MRKPDWKDAPKWASYLAKDKDDKWAWYSGKPKCDTITEQWVKAVGDVMYAEEKYNGWKESLEERPK